MNSDDFLQKHLPTWYNGILKKDPLKAWKILFEMVIEMNYLDFEDFAKKCGCIENTLRLIRQHYHKNQHV